MKKILVVVVALAISVLGATAALAVVAGSQHDLSAHGVGGSVSTDPCVNCHTPHGGTTTGAPLWNRDLNTGAGINGVTGNNPDPRGTQTCLSCHDGALDSTLQNVPGIGGRGQMGTFTFTPRTNGFFDLSGVANHPVGVVFPAGTTGFKANAGSLPLYNGSGATGGTQVECATCHDVHNGQGIQNGLFPRAGFACATCHDK